MDEDRDGYVDEEELVSGVRQMFATQSSLPMPNAKQGLSPEALFSRMDAD